MTDVITRVAEGIKEKPVRVNTSRYKKIESMKKTHHASFERADDNAAPYMMMMHQSRTCERNSWTITSMVLANLYPQLLQLNLCLIFLGYFALRNVPRTIYSFDQKRKESFRVGNRTNKDFFDCDGCEYISRRTIEPEEHPQDHQCKKYKLSHKTDIKSVD